MLYPGLSVLVGASALMFPATFCRFIDDLAAPSCEKRVSVVRLATLHPGPEIKLPGGTDLRFTRDRPRARLSPVGVARIMSSCFERL